jgi:PAB-dependent poly(A)-specific ribonuclease subunit 3
LYAPPLPHVLHLHPNQRAIQAFFLPDDLRVDLTKRNEEYYRTVDDRSSSPGPPLPAEVNKFHSLCPLEKSVEMSKLFGFPSMVYKAVSGVDGSMYALRRLEGYKLIHESSMSVLDSWTRLSHTNIVQVREAFTTKAFNDDSLMFVSDYHPLAQTLLERHFLPRPTPVPTSATAAATTHSTYHPSHSHPSSQTPSVLGASQHATTSQLSLPEPVLEPVLWSYLIQMASALKAIHVSGLACRTLEPSKVLVIGKSRWA